MMGQMNLDDFGTAIVCVSGLFLETRYPRLVSGFEIQGHILRQGHLSKKLYFEIHGFHMHFPSSVAWAGCLGYRCLWAQRAV